MIIIDNDIAYIIKENENLIYSIINKYTLYYEKEDLYQVASIGFIKAYKNYKKDKSTKFTTYAYTYILSEVINYVNNSKAIKTSKEYHKLYKKILEAKTILTQKLMRKPSNKEISIFLEVDEELITNIEILEENIQSLDQTLTEDGKTLSLLDKINKEVNNINIDNIYLYDEISKLTNEEKKLIYLRYFNDYTQSETAKYFNTNQVTISRNEKKVLSKLKKNMTCNT